MRSVGMGVLAIAMTSMTAFTVSSQAAILAVPGDYPTIQSAIDAATDGDEVVVEPGIYSETIDFLGKDIVVRSAMGPEKTILDGTGLDSSLVRCVSGEPATARLAGFTLRKGWAGSPLPANTSVIIGGGLAVSNASPTIENCHFINNRTYYGGGAYFYQSESRVVDCVFHQNRAYTDGGGAQVFRGHVVFEGCGFTYNLAVNSHGGGVHVTQGSATFMDCSLSNNTANIGGGICHARWMRDRRQHRRGRRRILGASRVHRLPADRYGGLRERTNPVRRPLYRWRRKPLLQRLSGRSQFRRSGELRGHRNSAWLLGLPRRRHSGGGRPEQRRGRRCGRSHHPDQQLG